MPDPTAYIQETMVSALRRLKDNGVPAEAAARFRAEVFEGNVIYWQYIHLSGKKAEQSEQLCCFVALCQQYLQVFGSGTDEEMALADEWRMRERAFVLPSARQSKNARKPRPPRPMEVTAGRIVEALGTTVLSEILDAIEDEHDVLLDAVYDKYGDPSPVKFIDIDRKRDLLIYRSAGGGEKKTITTGAFDKHLRKFRK